MIPRLLLITSVAVNGLLLSGCQTQSGTGSDTTDTTSAITSGDWYQPKVSASWQWQLQGTINTGYNVDIYDIDLFDTDTSTIAALQSTGKKVICYFSAGSWENWRDDADQFNDSDLGDDLDGWAGERWLDTRSDNVRNIMKTRLDTAVSKGCDGVEPDNMDGYQNDTSLGLSASTQLNYNRFIANAAHERNLAVALKNDLDQIDDLVDYFDFSVNEQCFQYDECDLLQPFIDADKPVLNAEYNDTYKTSSSARDALCTQSINLQFSTLILALDLDDSYRDSCF